MEDVKMALYRSTRAHKKGICGVFDTPEADYLFMDDNDKFHAFEFSRENVYLSVCPNCGDYNYLVVPKEKVPDAENLLKDAKGVGLMMYYPENTVYGETIQLRTVRAAKMCEISMEQRISNMRNMLMSTKKYITWWVKNNKKHKSDDWIWDE